MTTTLCAHIDDPSPRPSPLEKVAQLGYYDGITDGFCRCRFCGRPYYVRAIAFWGGPTHSSRVFALSTLPSKLDGALQHLCDGIGLPSTPRSVWNELARLAKRRRSPSRAICLDLHADKLLGSCELPGPITLPARDAIARATVETDVAWFQLVVQIDHAA